MQRGQVVFVVLGVGALVALLLSRRRSRRNVPHGSKDQELLGMVEWTSRLCAAGRALETQQPDALYQDPLAEALAGDDAMEYVRQRLTTKTDSKEEGISLQEFMGIYSPNLESETLGTIRSSNGSGEHRHGRFGVRVKYLDNKLLELLDQKTVDGRPPQVVVLGAGMDTRAYRLPLPPGVRWFEVDVPSVLEVKHRLLRSIRAEVPENGESLPDEQVRHPLRVARYAAAAGDLGDGTWAASLHKAGWDASLPTVYIAEGLVRYLKPPVLKAMMQTASQEAAPGSTFVATMHPASNIAAVKARAPKGLNEHVYWGFPDDPAEAKSFFQDLGWWQTGHDTSSSIAKAVCGAEAKFSFPLRDGKTAEMPAEGDYLFFVAENRPAQ